MKKEINEVKYKWESEAWAVIDTHRNEIKVVKSYPTYSKAYLAAAKLNKQHENENLGAMGIDNGIVIPRYGVQLAVVNPNAVTVKEDIIDSTINKITEALSTGARIKAKQSMKRRAPMMQKKRAIASRKSANKGTVERRATKSAHNIILQKKILHGRDKSLMSPSQKHNIEKQMQAYAPAVQKLAKKMFSKVKKAGEVRRHSVMTAKR
jgi:C4-dicarboxylate-specific signal transduction histidine kinase